MKFLSNRKVAWAVLAVCILTSIVGFGGGSLAAQRRDAMRVFDEGIDTSFAVRFSMDAYLDNCAGYARTMAEEHRLYADLNSETANTVLELAEKIGDGDLDGRAKAYKELCSKVESLYTEFHAADVAEKNRELFKNAYANYQGEVSKIKYDEYHVIAAEFNNAAGRFPANVIGALMGIDSLNPF